MRYAQKRVPLLALIVAAVTLTVMLAVALVPARATATEGNATATEANATTTQADASALEIKTVDGIVGKRIGMVTGAAFDKLLMNIFDGIKQDDIVYYNSVAELIGALKANKIDVVITDLPIAQLAVSRNTGVGIIPESIVEDAYAYVLPKDDPLTSKINERLAHYRDDGTIDQLKKKWTAADESTKTMPEKGWATPNGTLNVATSTDNAPISYLVNGEPHGMCIELLELVLCDLGYGVKYSSTNSGSLIAEIQSSKADIAASSFSITEERKKMVDMTDPYYDGGVTAIVRAETPAGAEDQGFFVGLANSFKRTFIEENRWELVLSGLGVTLVIAVASGALGFALGFLFVLLRRKKEGGIAEKLIHLLESVLGGLPVVVVLMIFYYVVFGAINISGIIVAIIVFTILFGASSGSIMWNAVRAVDVGQTEAGRALGFGDRDTFFLVVLPQAARQFAPLVLSQFVTLVKETSIVGFIAVQDLTRVGDIIRARTMEAFFPLIAIAIIYFLICRLLAWLLGLLVKKLEPKDGPRTIKGVEL